MFTSGFCQLLMLVIIIMNSNSNKYNRTYLKITTSPIEFPSLKLLIIHLYIYIYAAAAKSLQSCLTLCDLTDGSLPGSSVSGILQARTLEWVAISFSNAWKWKAKVKSLSHAQLLATPWTAAYQAPPSMGFSRREYWSPCYFLLQGIFPTQELNPGFLHCRQTLYPLSHQGSPGYLKKTLFNSAS